MVEETGSSAVFRVPSSYATIGAALAAATPAQGTVLVDAGTYREACTLKVAAGVTLEGSGLSTIIESDATVVACADGAVRVANLTIRQCAEESAEPRFGIEVRGKTLLDNCHISALCRTKNACALLARGTAAAPTVRGCVVQDSGQAGVLLASGARASLIESDVRNCGSSGVLVLANCVLDVQGGHVSGCTDGALAVAGRAAATLSGCELSGNGGATVSAKAFGRLVMKQCTVRDASGIGVQLADGAEGNIANCKLLGCAKAAVAAKAAGRLQISSCEIADGAAAGIMLLGASTPAQPGGAPPSQIVKGNIIRANAKAGVQISADACPTIDSNRIIDGKGAGVHVFGGARPVLVDNLVQRSLGPAIRVENAAPRIERNSCCSGADVRTPRKCLRPLAYLRCARRDRSQG
jgi:hypothetical protein